MTASVGRPLRRREDFRFLTGRGRYVDDIKLPGTLHLAILRSPHAHAIIAGVDLSAAKAAAGVRSALAGPDLPGKIGNIKPNWIIPGTVAPDRPVIAVDRVRFVGECIAFVVAETREALQPAERPRHHGLLDHADPPAARIDSRNPECRFFVTLAEPVKKLVAGGDARRARKLVQPAAARREHPRGQLGQLRRGTEKGALIVVKVVKQLRGRGPRPL